MKKRIGIIELAHHNEVLRAYLVSFLKTEFEISVFTNKFNYNQIYDFQEHENINWKIKQEEESYADFFERVKGDLNSCAIFLISTLPRNSFFHKFKLPAKSILLIHDNHYYFEPKTHLSARTDLINNTKDNLKIVKYFLQNTRQRNLKFLDQFDHLAFPAESVKNYVSGKEYIDRYTEGLVFDFAVSESNSPTIKKGKAPIKITVPGMVHNKSRDYLLLFDAINKLKKDLVEPVVLNILGKAKGRSGSKHLNALAELQGGNLKIITHKDYIDQQVYDKIMKGSDFLVLPIREHLRFDICLEKNGYSCVSGNINDISKYGIPAIVPHYYPLNSHIEKMVMRYDISYELSDKILEWIRSRAYKGLRQNAMEHLKAISEQAMGRKFQEQIVKLI